jgi:isopenicillin N synthase-like dioxygenase
MNALFSIALLCELFSGIANVHDDVLGTPPTISIAALLSTGASSADTARTRQEIVRAIETWGFFHVTDHGISDDLRSALQREMRSFFFAPLEVKTRLRRSRNNSRGFADDELTKQKTDAKQILDLGHKPFPHLADDAPENIVLDGCNQYPSPREYPNFRRVFDEWWGNCTVLSATLTSVLAEELGAADVFSLAFANHTSFLRLNYYPTEHAKAQSEGGESTLGVSRHTDAGFLTVLLQDDEADDALEVYSGSREKNMDGSWVPVKAVRGALTINTGDMLQVFSNNRFKAPEHRVRRSVQRERFSAPFFYNPSYDTNVAPLPVTGSPPLYKPINWGVFRSNRFKGDYQDHGLETQIEDWLVSPTSTAASEL